MRGRGCSSEMNAHDIKESQHAQQTNRGVACKMRLQFAHLRELRSIVAAVPTRDVAMSTPLFPIPTTTTRLPSKPWGFLYLTARESGLSEAIANWRAGRT